MSISYLMFSIFNATVASQPISFKHTLPNLQYKRNMWLMSVLILVLSCQTLNAQTPVKPNKQALIKQIKTVEKQFENMLNSKGAAAAFYYFAADNATIKRENDTLITGKNQIKKYYEARKQQAKAHWLPDYIDIADDGSMAYTFGKYEWAIFTDNGQTKTYRGVFHTVWKKMPNRQWKYVWD